MGAYYKQKRKDRQDSNHNQLGIQVRFCIGLYINLRVHQNLFSEFP